MPPTKTLDSVFARMLGSDQPRGARSASEGQVPGQRTEPGVKRDPTCLPEESYW